ncbi:hypothetical protein DQ239_17520 [Blastococcus sp. TF02-09]|uniref:hypothetical protein n=1 Tax=Blastococcus sp. TF02-09 TaxID=2250576 RepID=UPI000DEA2EC2|nr:hypothetical protein [Blastococcus sp. TF02-9]RBY75143.1 hypothetical protein DQ239_17520 [Blastococcus sp. TF02-9]
MDGPRSTWPLLAMATLLAAAPALAACATAGADEPASAPDVAEFRLGAETPEARQFVLTPFPGPRVDVIRPPSPAPELTVPDPGEGVDERTDTPAPAPDSGGRSPLESAYQPSIAWVNHGQYLGVITFGSSSCPSGPLSVEVVAEQQIAIRLGELFPDQEVCSADMSGHVTVVELPSGITPTKPLVARLGDYEVTIEAVDR